MQEMTVEQLKSRLEQNADKPLLIDVREPWEFAVCHIDGSKLVPMREIPNKLNDIEADKDIIVICHTGMRSRQVCYFLENAGFGNVFNLSGGVHAWAQQIDPNMPTY